ncbi:MAG: hypothetical protein IJS00_05790 [Paludibacteraceae bacterium]|nr:hypothetical protein [Paludibacteraceae bacterium]
MIGNVNDLAKVKHNCGIYKRLAQTPVCVEFAAALVFLFVSRLFNPLFSFVQSPFLDLRILTYNPHKNKLFHRKIFLFVNKTISLHAIWAHYATGVQDNVP